MLEFKASILDSKSGELRVESEELSLSGSSVNVTNVGNMNVTHSRNFSTLRGFTLAEVLITLGVIGVVAAITMPMLITNINDRANSERHANIAYKMTQAMEQMRAHGELVRYDSTEAFVDKLQKYLKITKRCDNEHIAECWPTEKVTTANGDEYEVANCKTSDDIGLSARENKTNNVGLILADGASLILNYDNNYSGLDVGDKVTASNISLPIGKNKTKSFAYTTNVTAPITFITDVNGKKGPNSETKDNKYYDIRSFNGGAFAASTAPTECYNGNCIYYLGTSYESMDCNYYYNSIPENMMDYCGRTGWNSDSSWAGAIYKCDTLGMKLATWNELISVYENKSHYPSVNSSQDWYWTSDETAGMGGMMDPSMGMGMDMVSVYIFNMGDKSYSEAPIYMSGTQYSAICTNK